MKTKLTILISFCLLMLMSGLVFADYTPIQAWMEPDNLTVILDLAARAPVDNFTRSISFKNQAGATRSVVISFRKTGNWIYTGTITAGGLTTLQSMVEPNNRSYWDTMYFNNGGNFNFAMDINVLEMWIRYDSTSAERAEWQDLQIAYETDKSIAANRSLYLNNASGRVKFAKDKFGWTQADYNTLPSPARAIIEDIGKSGSSDSSDSKPVNPKYGLDIIGPYYCGQFISWYYYEAGYKLYGNQVYDFLAPQDVPGEMGDWFQEAGYRYDFDYYTKKFCFTNPDGTLDQSKTIIPKPGDYFGYYGQHAMMLIQYDADTNTAVVVDGPYPANYRTVDVEDWDSSKPVFIGRIPPNRGTERILKKTTINQTGPDYWKTIKFNAFYNDPIVVMGIPSYNGNHQCTMRINNVTNSGFQFQLDEWNYHDGIHTGETVDYLVFENGCQVFYGTKVEAGKVKAVDENWVEVDINHVFSSPPVVLAQCVSRNGSAAVTTRVKNVTRDSFWIHLQEEEGSPDGGVHYDEEVHYILYEQTSYAFLASNVTDAWYTLPGPSSYSPITSYVFGSIQTFNGSDPCALRNEMYGIGDYDIKIEEETSADSETRHAGETVGILRIIDYQLY